MAYWRLHYHLVWATRNRELLVDEPKERAIERSLRETADRLGLTVHAIGLMPDHCHVAVSIPPKYALTDEIRQMKGASSHVASLATGDQFSWQGGYGALTFSDRGIEDVIAYVHNQKVRHAQNDVFAKLERSESEDWS